MSYEEARAQADEATDRYLAWVKARADEVAAELSLGLNESQRCEFDLDPIPFLREGEG